MGRLLLGFRLVRGDIKRRGVHLALLLVLIATTTTTLTLGLILHRVTESPWARTFAVTKGPDIVAEFQPNPGSRSAPVQQFASLLHARGVVATAGPFPVAFTRLDAPRISVPVQAEGRDRDTGPTDRPLLTAGRWASPGTAVLERGLADALGLHVGDSIRVGGHRFRVAGIALQTEQPFYPAQSPGLIWLTRTDAAGLASSRQPLGYVLGLKLANPASTTAFADGAAANAYGSATANEAAILQTWQDTRSGDYTILRYDQKVLLVASWLLALLSIASIAVAIGGRMAEQTKRVGLLKAIGATPALVAAVLLAENLVLALAAAAVGLTTGVLLAPLLTNPGNGLLVNSGSPALTIITIAEVLIAALAVATAATVAPALRGVRTSTISALNDPAHPPRRRSRWIATSARLPVTLLLGLHLVARRTRRSVLTGVSLMIAVAMIVATLELQHNIDTKSDVHAPTGFIILTNLVANSVSHVVFVLSAILVVLAAINAIFTTSATVIDAARFSALSRALGATPRQVGTAMTTAQLIPGLAAACLGIPAGISLYALAGGGSTSLPILWSLAVIPATLIVVATLTAIPARIGANRPVAEVLRSE